MTLKEAVVQARMAAAQHKDSGVDIRALEAAARLALANGAFEDSEDDTPDIVEEFFPTSEQQPITDGKPATQRLGLADKLAEKAEHASNNIPNS
ncbi:hypothetical protein [Propionivibrio dicarboxylicus]|uniref:hypothetical protein n=1 Tax=Propionivibrio dicarboxylicus TaxID=83767 RepID=UPI000B8A608A|nr:hypothetical protein [Propionivibrio dicarboxylicus]